MSRVFKDIKVPLPLTPQSSTDDPTPQPSVNSTLPSPEECLFDQIKLLAPEFQPSIQEYRIYKKSLDARRKRHLHFKYTVEVADAGEKLAQPEYLIEKRKTPLGYKPLIIGAGPAGLFAALRLTERGVPCHIFERGGPTEERTPLINKFWRYGQLNSKNNVCYGEGGAGLFSDGKLITRIKSPHIPYVLHRLVKFGAPKEIQFLSNPHVGSDRLRRVIPLMRKYLIHNGCTFHFNTRVKKILFDSSLSHQGKAMATGIETEYGEQFYSPAVVLSTGHSAVDIMETLFQEGVAMEGKSFAIGLRIEHPQKWINTIQYRQWAQHPHLKAASYKLTFHDPTTQMGVYSFCMCPGGYVLSCGTESDGVVSNGMSNYHRSSPFSNSAIVVTINHEKISSSQPITRDSVMQGLKLRRLIESEAFLHIQKGGGKHQLPVQKVIDFMQGKPSENLFPGSCPSGLFPVNFHSILPPFITHKIQEGLIHFDKTLPHFIHDQAQLYGVETRTSCPIRITRDPQTYESLSHNGLFPCGEGAGYAGGITSSACDGITVAEKILQNAN